MKKVLIHLADGFEEIEAITPIDVLRRAGCEVVTISITNKNEVSSRRGVVVMADKRFEEVDYNSADMIILPGGQPGADNLNNHEGLKNQILQFNAQGKWLAAICAAPLVFGQMGILKGRRATSFPGTESMLTGATVSGNRVEIDGNIITAKGPGVALEFSFVVAEKLIGNAKTDEVRKAMIAV